eukprot:689575-Pelagomonas_calceolata.AAC.3
MDVHTWIDKQEHGEYGICTSARGPMARSSIGDMQKLLSHQRAFDFGSLAGMARVIFDIKIACNTYPNKQAQQLGWITRFCCVCKHYATVPVA